MTGFWLAAALLALVAAACIAVPLLRRRAREALSGSGAETVSRDALNVSVYRDQLRELEADRAAGMIAEADYQRARAELERRLLEDVQPGESTPAARTGRGLAFAALAVPLIAAVVYLAVGNPGAINVDADAQARITPEQVERMVGALAERLRQDPEDDKGWRLLGRSYTVLGRYAEAADAYAKAAARAPRDAQLLADFADALAMARGQNLQGEPEKLVLRALEIDPDNLKALALAGTAAFERKDFAGAAALWERMLPHVPPGSEDARTIQSNVEEARTLAKSGAATQKALTGTVRLDPKLAGEVSPEDSVFIFARAAEGPPMPLAVLRRKAGELPIRFSLDDTMAMSPAMRLSSQKRVVVGARISKSGEASARSGDLQGFSKAAASDAQGLTIVVDTVVP